MSRRIRISFTIEIDDHPQTMANLREVSGQDNYDHELSFRECAEFIRMNAESDAVTYLEDNGVRVIESRPEPLRRR